jgi:hypothetical protein
MACPAQVITHQEIPAGGFPQPKVRFLTRWGLEILIAGLYTVGGVFFFLTNRKKILVILLIPGFIIITAGIVFRNSGLITSYSLIVIRLLVLAVGVYYFIRQPIPKQQDSSQPL